MSSINGGLFYLIANDNVIDKYLINKDYLKKRIESIRLEKRKQIDESIESKTRDLQILNNALSNNELDSSVYNQIIEQIRLLENQIQILKNQPAEPTITDIRESHAFFLTDVFKPIVSVGYWYSQTNNNIQPLLGGSWRIAIPLNGDFFTDMVLSIQLSSFKAKNSTNKVKYYDFPGHKLIKEVRFISNDILIDSYGTEEINFHYDFRVPNSQKAGWKRCVGQELPKRCFFTQDPLNQEVREEKLIYDGYQTLKYEQEEMMIFMPLQFWFCDPKFAMSNNNFTYGKTYLEVDFARSDEITMCADYNNDGGLYTPPEIIECNLFTNHIFVSPEVASIFLSKFSFNIIRIHKRVNQILNKPKDEVLLNSLKFAIETMYVVFRPIENTTNTNASETWNKNTSITYTELSCPSIITTAGVKTLGYTNAYYYSEDSVIDSLGLSSNGSTVYDHLHPTFYDSYIPYRFGKNSVITPVNSGSYLITFNLYPNKEQPSGYLNLSNTRDTYLRYSSHYISMSTPVNLIVSARTINFLLLEEGTITLRFIT
jgi:hypothetical protein